MKRETKTNVVSAVLGIAIAIPLSIYATNHPEPSSRKVLKVENAVQVDVEASIETTSPAIVKETVPTEETTTAKPLMDVPIDDDLQLFIIKTCEEKHISPAFVMAIIEQESCFIADAVGDNGNSIGLMQIQPRWNQERMDRLGCTNLLNPYENVTVGIDILAELFSESEDVAIVLMAYNGGFEYALDKARNGIITEYATNIMQRATKLGNGVY